MRGAYARVLANAEAAHPGAAIQGVLVQQMAPPGVEIILGVTRDPDFGPMLMVGLGGIHVEVLRDVAFSPVPIGPDEAQALLGELKGGALLDGVRGAPPADRAALAELIAALSRFAADHADQIDEIDLNPVIVHPQGQGVTDRRRADRQTPGLTGIGGEPVGRPTSPRGRAHPGHPRLSRLGLGSFEDADARTKSGQGSSNRAGVDHDRDPSYREIGVSHDGHVATVEMRRPPHNFFDSALVAEIGDAFERLDDDPDCRAVVFAAEGRSFCAGADFSKRMDTGTVSESSRSDCRPASLQGGDPAVPHQKADRRRGAGCGGRRRARSGTRRRFSRDLPGGAVQREFQPPRLSSRLRVDRDPAAAGRRAAGGLAVLHRAPHPGRRSGPHRSRRSAWWRRARCAAPPRHWRSKSRNPHRSPSWRRARRYAAGSSTRSRRRPNASSSSRIGCAAREDFQEGIKAMADRRLPDFRGR